MNQTFILPDLNYSIDYLLMHGWLARYSWFMSTTAIICQFSFSWQIGLTVPPDPFIWWKHTYVICSTTSCVNDSYNCWSLMHMNQSVICCVDIINLNDTSINTVLRKTFQKCNYYCSDQLAVSQFYSLDQL